MAVRKKYVILSLIAFLVFLPLIPYVRMPSECIFCKILQGKVPETKIEMETPDFVIFADIKPASTHHYLAVSKRHIESLKTLTKDDEDLINNMESGLKQFFTAKSIDSNDSLFGFHMPPFTSVKHLHMHGISPRSGMGFFSRYMFRPGTAWFKTVDDAKIYVREKVQ